MIAKAMQNVENALYGEIKLRPQDLVSVSLRFLEKVSDDFKDKVEINGKVDVDTNVTIEELLAKANALATSLKTPE